MSSENNSVEQDKLRRLVCVEYPGIVNNVDKMMETLGGRDKMSEVYADENRRLELRFRPEDCYCRPTCGERHNSTSLLIKVTRKRKKKIINDSNSKPEETYHTKAIGVVPTSFKFDNLCDFQYLPMENKSDGTAVVYEDLLPQGIVSSDWLNGPAPMFFPPAAFSRMDTPQDYRYKKESATQESLKKGPHNIITRKRLKRSHNAIFLVFSDESVPKGPLPSAVAQLKYKFLDNTLYESVKNAFKQRPIWSKNALGAFLKIRKDKLKYLLPTMSYYFHTGPWKNLWVRFEYDPRKDPTAWVYQTFDFRIRQAGGMKTKVEAKRSYANYLLPYKSVNLAKKKSTTIQSLHLSGGKGSCQGASNDSPSTSKVQDTPGDEIYLFRPGTIPPYRQMFYQYCDVHVPEVQNLLEASILSGANKICSEKNGWLPSGVEAQCRDILSQMVEKSLEETYGEEGKLQEGGSTSDSEGEDSPLEGEDNSTEEES